MIFEELRDDFLKKMSLAQESDDDSEEYKLENRIEVERHVKIWNKMAEFMGYGVLIAPNLCRFIPIYFNRRFPSGKTYVETSEGLFTNVEDYNSFEDYIKTEYVKKYHLDDWAPTLDFNNAKECEAKLLKVGEYQSVNIKINSREASKTIIYFNSISNKNISGTGKNELEAICDACNNFMNRERGKQLDLFDNISIEGNILPITH